MSSESGSDGHGDNRVDLAEDRTDYAEDRTLLANQRTFAAWLRTGLTSVGVALGVQALLREITPDWPGKAIATVFALTAAAIFATAARDHIRVAKRLSSHKVARPPRRDMAASAVVLAAAAIATAGAFWFLG